ncbi:13784_t:CDS:2, partial [Racocetra persica]
MPLPTLVLIQKDFNASVLAIDTFVWAACSDELATRKKVFLASFLVLVSASVACAVATNIWLLTAMRAIQSCGSFAAFPLGAGVISDIYDPLERGRAFGIFYFVHWIGYLGTILGGFIAQYLGGKYSDFLSKKSISISGGDCPEVRIKSLGSFGMLVTFSTLSTYLVDSCPGRGASVMALASLIRFGVPGVLTIFETSIEESLGVHWMLTSWL